VNSREDTVEIRFSDFGSGIPEEIREKIFEEGFTNGPNAGSGIGLFIAKKLIESYTGTISVESNQPKGTTFVVSLPAAGTS
jgi:signal transduction histidine kinase